MHTVRAHNDIDISPCMEISKRRRGKEPYQMWFLVVAEKRKKKIQCKTGVRVCSLFTTSLHRMTSENNVRQSALSAGLGVRQDLTK